MENDISSMITNFLIENHTNERSKTTRLEILNMLDIHPLHIRKVKVVDKTLKTLVENNSINMIGYTQEAEGEDKVELYEINIIKD